MLKAETMAGPSRAGLREWFGLAVLGLPALLIGLDFTMLHLAAPHLAADLRPSGAQLLWIIDIYGFLIAGFLVTMGTLGDRIGRRRLLMIGGVAFAVGSVVAAYSGSTEMLIVSRALLGIAGATLMPSTLSLISNMFADPGQRRLAIAVWMTSFMLGGMIGPVVGGALLEHFWWGSVFLVNIPVLLILLAAGPLVLPEYRDPHAGRIDVISVVLSIAAVLLVIYGIKEIAESGVHGTPLVAIAAGLVAGWRFIRRQRRLADPILDLTLFTRPAFTVSLSAQALGLFVLAATQFLILQYFQLVLEMPPLRAGLWTIPPMIAGIVGTLMAPAVVRWLRPGPVMSGALVLAVVGLGLITQVNGDGLVLPVVGFAIVTFTIQAVLALTVDIIVSSVPPQRAGIAVGMGETGAELGIALGVAAAGSIVTAVYRSQVTEGALPASLPSADVDAARDTLAGAADVAAQLPEGAGADMLDLAQQAFTDGVQLASIVNAVIAAGLAILTGLLLRRHVLAKSHTH